MKKSKQAVSVILNADVDGLGFVGEHLVVKPGFARNFLLAGRRAELATPRRLKARAAEIERAEAKRAAAKTEREQLATDIAATPLKATLKVGPNQRVFGSLTAAEVAKQLQARKVTVTAKQLTGLPIKALGSHQVSVKLGLGVTATLSVEISPAATKTEADTKPAPPKTAKPAKANLATT